MKKTFLQKTLTRCLAGFNLLFFLIFSHFSCADTLRIAVATNFLPTAEELVESFEAETRHKVTISSGSSGSLYAQILNGAPYDLFLSADEERPTLLAEKNAQATLFAYATGRLALWWPGITKAESEDWVTLLGNSNFRHLALANPRLAPYGAAAQQTLNSLNLETPLKGRQVLGENIGQAYAMVASGNAELGFVAWSQLQNNETKVPQHSYRLIPENLHAPVLQFGIIIKHSAVAEEFKLFLASEPVRQIIVSAGYGLPGHD